MKNKIEDLRNHLFSTLEALQDPDNPMAIDRAIAIANVAKVIVESAKAEVAFMQVVGDTRGTGFIPLADGATTPAPLQLSGAASLSPLRICEKCKRRSEHDPCEHCGTARKRAVAA